MPRTYAILYECLIDPGNIQFVAVDPPQKLTALESIVKAKWSEVLEKNPSAFPGPVLSIRDIVFEKERVVIKYGMTTYDWFLGTASPNTRNKYGVEATHTATGVCIVITTADNNVLLHLRGRDMAYRRLLHVPGGMLSEPNPEKIISKEVQEEIGISLADCKVWLIGVASDLNPGRLNHELIFCVDVPLKFSEIRRKHQRAPDKDEGILIPVPNKQNAIESFLELGAKPEENWVPTGHAALVIYGRSQGFWKDTAGFPKLIVP